MKLKIETIVTAVVVLILNGEAHAQSLKTSNVSIRIDCIASCNQHKSSSIAFLKLQFVNSNDKGVTIPFFRMVGKNPQQVLAKLALAPDRRKYKTNGKSCSEDSFGGDCSSISYAWSDSKNNTILRGAYALTRTDLQVGAKNLAAIYVPISAPMRAGAYKLSVLFDNKHLSKEVYSCNDFDPDFMYTFFQNKTDSILNVL